MPHTRKRHALPLFQKKLRFSRVITIQGARQTGKSFFAREIISNTLSRSHYLTLDLKSQQTFASDNPETFLQQYPESQPLIIDEAQKSPPLFDAIKAAVDVHPHPGQFVLLGSTEFSREVQIRESLTGRVSRIRLYSMNSAECLNLAPNSSSDPFFLNVRPRASRAALLQHLQRGGFPGIFAVRDESSRQALLQDWLDVTIQRDLTLFPKHRVDPSLAMDILTLLPHLEEPIPAALAAKLRRDTRTIQRVLHLLEVLFAVHRIDPHPLGTGKPRYYLCDPGLASFLGAPFERALETWFLHEQLSQRSYRGDTFSILHYYRTTKGSILHFIASDRRRPKELNALKILDRERMDLRELEVLRAFGRKCEKAGLIPTLSALASTAFHLKDDRIRGLPWESPI